MASLINDSVITSDEITDTLETMSINYINEKTNIKWIVTFFKLFY